MSIPLNRRRFERFEVPAPYSLVRIRPLWSPDYTHEGHVYDISEGGVRFEADDPLPPGTAVAMELELPSGAGKADPESRHVYVFGNIIWLNEEDLPGPVRMAAAFTRFALAGDRERLMRRLVSGRYARAA